MDSRVSVLILLGALCCLFSVSSAASAFPMGLAQNPMFGDQTRDALVDMTEPGTHKDKFLRSFCRYCHSQPFFCGELLELCYARFRFRS